MSALSERQLQALRKVSDPDGGLAGSRWYPGSWLGGIPVTRALNKRGFIVPDKSVGAGLNWRITDSGRAALSHNGKET